MIAPFDKKETLTALRCLVLSGEDTVSRDRMRTAFVAALDAACGPLTHEGCDPDTDTDSFAIFLQNMLTPSLFQETRVFRLRHAQALDDEDLNEINTVLDGNIPGVHLIIEIDDAKKGAPKILKKLHIDKRSAADPPTCLHQEFPKPRDYAIADWLVAQTPLLIGRRISKADAEYLADRIGYEVDRLHSELEKLDLHLAPGAPVNRAAIDHITEALRQMTPFELAAAVGRRDFPLALRVIEALFSVNVKMPLITAALARHFWALLRIRKFLAANPDVGKRFAASKGRKNDQQTETALAIGQAAGLLGPGDAGKIFPVIIKSGIVDQARNFSDDELVRIFGLLLDFDIGTKTGKVEPNDATALQMLCYRLTRGRALRKDGVAA
jgi:DNA polymerase III delta subunit